MAVRMRFPAQALEELKKEDPNTSVTVNYIRALAKTGKVPVVMLGRRHLINYDALLDYLAHPEKAQEPVAYGTIRKVQE